MRLTRKIPLGEFLDSASEICTAVATRDEVVIVEIESGSIRIERDDANSERVPDQPTYAMQNSLLQLAGLFDSGGPGDVGENKQRYLGGAYYQSNTPE
jgi:hypothetical protein